MNIYPRIKIELSQAEVEEVFNHRLDQICGSYFVHGKEIWIDHGGHGSGHQEPAATHHRREKTVFHEELVRAALNLRQVSNRK